ncbi:tautomerase family protein [Kineococcus indalonis]|uniref:tautomerase family protein n=1 Tax=Kineococcus indalonis TaxID=2696566 RepID=UPI001411FA87|nr:tautomerase family protein [Kineococcus indalonis]
MPLVRIDLPETTPRERRRAIGDAVHAGLVEGLGMPAEDRFQLLRAAAAESFSFDPHFMGGTRREPVFVEVLLVRGYPVEVKRAAFAALARHLEAAGVRPDDVFVALRENGPEDWYVGRAGDEGAA